MLERREHHISQEELLSYSSFASPHSGGSSIASSLDELAKGLATGTVSRGKAIRLVAPSWGPRWPPCRGGLGGRLQAFGQGVSQGLPVLLEELRKARG